MSNSISFTAAGIDVSSIVSGLIAVESQPITTLATRQAKVKLQSDAVARLKSNVTSLKTLAAGVLTNGVAKLGSSVSVPGAVSATLSWTGTPAIDVAAGVVDQLTEAGVRVTWVPGCSREDPDLYSYRRDGVTGRFAGVVRLLPAAGSPRTVAGHSGPGASAGDPV